jgi:hypothetical protein
MREQLSFLFDLELSAAIIGLLTANQGMTVQPLCA